MYATAIYLILQVFVWQKIFFLLGSVVRLDIGWQLNINILIFLPLYCK